MKQCIRGLLTAGFVMFACSPKTANNNSENSGEDENAENENLFEDENAVEGTVDLPNTGGSVIEPLTINLCPQNSVSYSEL